MTQNYKQIINNYNLGKTDSSLNTIKVPNIIDYGDDSLGNQYITYSFLRSEQDLEDTGYYTSDSPAVEYALDINQYNLTGSATGTVSMPELSFQISV